MDAAAPFPLCIVPDGTGCLLAPLGMDLGVADAPCVTARAPTHPTSLTPPCPRRAHRNPDYILQSERQPSSPSQGKRTLSDTLSLIFTAVTYHELFQLAARDALSTIAALDWSALYRRLAAAEAAEGPRFGAEAARAEIMEMGASAAEARAATQVLFASDGRIVAEVREEMFRATPSSSLLPCRPSLHLPPVPPSPV